LNVLKPLFLTKVRLWRITRIWATQSPAARNPLAMFYGVYGVVIAALRWVVARGDWVAQFV